MSKALYFLRSSEQNIVNTLVKIAHPPLDQKKHSLFYGLTTKDLGLYAIVNNTIAGAIWLREINSNIPTLSFAILPEFKAQGIGSFMMEQFLQEAATSHTELHIDISHKPKSIEFYKKFGFEQREDSSKLLLKKILEEKEIVRPSDGYDSSRWMD